MGKINFTVILFLNGIPKVQEGSTNFRLTKIRIRKTDDGSSKGVFKNVP